MYSFKQKIRKKTGKYDAQMKKKKERKAGNRNCLITRCQI